MSAFSLLGWAVGLGLWMQVTGGQLAAGVDLQAYIRAGHDLLEGHPIYTLIVGQPLAFLYSPTWAVALAALAWVPGNALQLAVNALDLLALRYLAGSWQRAGLAFLYPVTAYVIAAGNVDLVIAAAIVIAWRERRPEPLVVLALAKIAPALAVPPSLWRPALIALALAVAITAPWLWLWPAWIGFLMAQPPLIGISIIPIPWVFRLPIALGLLLARRPWASALAVVVAMPSLYLSTLVVLFAPIVLYLDQATQHAEPPLHMGPASPVLSRS